MGWGVAVFLVVVGLLVYLSILGSKDTYPNDEEMDTVKNNESKNDIIDFRTSDSIPTDIRKLKEKVNNEIRGRQNTRKFLAALISLIVIIAGGVLLALPSYINSFNQNNKDDIKEDVYDEVKDDIYQDNNDDVFVDDIYNYEPVLLNDKELYKDTTLIDTLSTSEAVLKDFNFHHEKIEKGDVEFIIKANLMTMKFTKTEDIEKYFKIEENKKLNFEKRFLVNGDGVLIKYIYTVK